MSHDGPPDPDSGRLCIPRIRRTTSLSISTPKANVICSAIRGQPHVGLPFHFNDGIDQFFFRTFRTRPTPGMGRKQLAILSFDEQVMEMEQSGGPQNNRGPRHACWAHQKSAQSCNHPIGNLKIGSTLPAPIENQQLMSKERGFGNDGTQPTRLH